MKIAAVNTPFSTHIGRMVYVLEGLRAQGHEVELWGSGATRTVAERHEFVYREIPVQTDFTAVLRERLQPPEIFTKLFFQLAREQLPVVLEYCDKYGPDVIEGNSRVFAATLAAQMTGIPVVTHCCSGNSFSQIPEDLYGFCARGTESDRQNSIMLKLSREFFRETDDWFEAHIGRHFGLGRVHNAVGLCAPEFAIAQSIPALSKPRIAGLPNVHMTGPIVTEDPTDLDFTRYQPYCYMSLGTSPWNPSEIAARYRSLCEFVPEHLKVVIGLGSLMPPEELGIEDERVIVFERAPQIEAIRHSEFVVCHGGCQTVHEALYFAKPLVGIPHHAEISEMVNSVELAGAGVRIAPSKLNEKSARDAFAAVTTAELRSGAETLATLLREADGRENALALFRTIEASLATRC